MTTIDTAAMVRRNDPETSRAAAERAKGGAASLRHLCFVALDRSLDGLTDFELAAALGSQQTSVGKRRLELQRAGLVEYAGITRPSPSGSAARVWKVTR